MSAVEERSGERRGEIVVRARERGVVERLREVAPSATAIAISNTRDYRYRLWLSHQAWADALAEMGRAVTYDNFKSEVARVEGASRYERALHDVWAVMGETQPRGPYGQGGPGYPPVPEDEQE